MNNVKVALNQIKYFSVPVQIEYYDNEENKWYEAIGYYNNIINIRNGKLLNIHSVYKDNIKITNPIRIVSDGPWIDYKEYCFG